jgi:hypothetical protein
MIVSHAKKDSINDSILFQNDSIPHKNDSILFQNDSIPQKNDSILFQNDSITSREDSIPPQKIVTKNDSIPSIKKIIIK